MTIKEIHHLFDDFIIDWRDLGKTVSTTFYDMECGGYACFFQCRVEQFALVHGHDKVLVTMNDEARGITFADIGDRIGLPTLLRSLFYRGADQARGSGVFSGIVLRCLYVV